jgi:RNA polymerase sigma-70 factor (ECF subfamily)
MVSPLIVGVNAWTENSTTPALCKNRGRSPVVVGEMEGIACVDAQPRELTREEQFTNAVAPHYAGLVRRLTLVVGDHHAGEDLAQETYLRAYRAWARFDGRDVRAWLYTIGLRLAFNERERLARWSRLLGRPTTTERWTDATDRQLAEALAILNRQQRAALLLNAVDGYTQAEIALMLSVPPGTVASWLSRAKAQLREALSHD